MRSEVASHLPLTLTRAMPPQIVYKRYNGKACYTDDEEKDEAIVPLESVKMTVGKCYEGRDIARHMPST